MIATEKLLSRSCAKISRPKTKRLKGLTRQLSEIKSNRSSDANEFKKKDEQHLVLVKRLGEEHGKRVAAQDQIIAELESERSVWLAHIDSLEAERELQAVACADLEDRNRSLDHEINEMKTQHAEELASLHEQRSAGMETELAAVRNGFEQAQRALEAKCERYRQQHAAAMRQLASNAQDGSHHVHQR